MFTDVRICVIQDSKIINETIFNEGETVHLGLSLDNEVVLMGDEIPDTVDLFLYNQGVYYLKLFPGINGRVFEDNKILSFEELIKNSNIIRTDSSVYVPLSQNARGSVVFGKNTILFRMNPSIPIPTEVPKEFKTNIFTDLDFSFLLISSMLFLAYIIMVSSFLRFKPSQVVKFEDVPDRFARLIMDKPVVVKEEKLKPLPMVENKILKEAEKPEQEIKVDKVSENVKKTGADDKLKRNVSGTKREGGGGPVNKQEVAELVRTAGIIGIIGAKSNSASGNVINLFAEQGFGKKLDEAMKGVAGLNTGASLDDARMKRGSGSAKAINIGDLKTTTGSGAVAFGSTNVAAVNVLGNAEDSEQSGEGSINPGVIAKTLSRHVGAFQYCYNKSLRTNAGLSGELKVIFVILESGDVLVDNIGFTGPAAKDTNLTSCIKRVFVRIKFPQPKGGEVTVGYPLNFTAQN